MRVLRSLIPLVSVFAMAILVRADTGAPPKPAYRLAVVPFARDGGVPNDWRFSLALPHAAAEKLERYANDPAIKTAMEGEPMRFEFVEWPLVLPDGVPAMMTDASNPDLAVAAEAVRKRGATHMLTGRYDGSVEKWSLTVEVYDVRTPAPTLAASAARSGSIFNLKTRVVDMAPLQRMLAEASVEALEASGLKLPEAARADFAAPATKNSWAFILLGRAYARHFWPKDRGKHRTALEMADNAVDVDPEYVEARRLHAWLVWENGRTEKSAKKAVEIYVEALKRRPDDVRSLLGAGELASAAGDYDDAIAWLEKAVALRPDSAVGHRWLGVAYAGKGKTEDAFEHLERARDLDPSDLAIRRALKGLYARAHRYADAARELRAIVGSDPNDLAAVFELAACLRALGKLDEAAATYAAAETRFPKDARLPKFRGDVLAERGLTADAEAAYAAALKLAPKDPRLARKDPDTLGGTALDGEVAAALSLRGTLGATADAFQTFANDAEVEFWIRARWPKPKKGEEPAPDPRRDALCLNGAAAGNEAVKRALSYEEDAKRYRASVRKIAASLKNGEGPALTPDRLSDAESLVDEAERESRVAREMARTLSVSVPFLRRGAGCEEDPAAAADLKDVAERNLARVVPVDEYVGDAGSAIMPSIPPGASRVVRFRVDNARGTDDLALVMLAGGKPSGDPLPVPAGRSVRFSIKAGSYRYCLLPDALVATCGEKGTVRSNYLYEGVVITFY